ncbi:MAG TPA: YqiA/YcfP family alpha/beta fold hydrolase [Stellaceae bacterium]|nr:YqiA/YcfP family alpha/beta fold hydrolase [Stellaceae bacterium]
MIAYLHGFNSSPQSHKARQLDRYLRDRGLGAEYLCPALPPAAAEAVAVVEALMHAHRGPFCFVGSSLGGFYATWLAEKHDARAVLINPAIDPHVGLRALLGPQRNLHTGAPYELTPEHLRQWQELYCERLSPERYLLLVETGDEVLDYRKALARYAGAEQVVIPGGDHSLQSYVRHLPRILRFAGIGR